MYRRRGGTLLTIVSIIDPAPRRLLTALCACLTATALTGCLGRSKPLDQQPGYDDAHYSAQLYCSMTVNAGMYSDEMARCIREQTIANMRQKP